MRISIGKRILLLCTLICSSAISQPTNSPPWSAAGYIDGSYNNLLSNKAFKSGIYNRVYDINQNGMTLQQSSFTFAYQPKEGLGGLVNPIFGHDTFH